MVSHALNDKELFSLIGEGDKDALTQLYRKYAGQLIPFINGLYRSDMVTDEILQEIFMRVWFNREKLAVVQEPKSWLFRIAANVCYTFLRKALLEHKIRNVLTQETHYQNNEAIPAVRAYSLAADIHRALKSLKPEQKIIFQLNREKGLTVPLIAEELSISPNSVRSILNSSLEDVHDFLEAKGHQFLILNVIFFSFWG
jgi:RNA polymerase sigma-70 factor (ECF subfamily)